MNLYRSFGNLLESWVTKGHQDLYLQPGPGVDGFDSLSRGSVPLSNVKSESEDSGFETVSTTSPCHFHQCSALTSEESQPVYGSTEDEVRPSSPSPSMCSSSSSSVDLSSVALKTTHLEVEQVLSRTDSGSWRGPLQQTERGTGGPRYRSNTASFPSSFHSNCSRPRHRLALPRRTHSQPPDSKKAELYRKCLKSDQHGPPGDIQLELVESDHCRLDKLSPGLLYLEQVCRMMENIATLQQQNYSLQKEVEILKSQHAEKELRSFHEEEISYPASRSLQILGHEDPPSESTHLKEHMGFRHRSVSDTQAAVGRHRRTRFFRDKPIVDVLVEEPDGKDPLPGNEPKKLSKIQKLKFASFRRQETRQSDRESKRSPLWYGLALFLLLLGIGYAYTSLTFVLIRFSGRCSRGIGKIWKVFSQSLKEQNSLRVRQLSLTDCASTLWCRDRSKSVSGVSPDLTCFQHFSQSGTDMQTHR